MTQMTPPPPPVPPASQLPATLSEDRGIVRAAAVLAVGNVLSRVLGLARTLAITAFFGASGPVSAYRIAIFIPMSIFQLIVGGEMVNSSLVPVFSEFAASDEPEKRAELWTVVNAFLTLALLALTLLVLIVELFAPQFALLLGAGKFSDVTLQATTVRLMRIATPAVLFLSLANLLSGVLYALKRFTLPAFTAATLNATIVVFAFLGATVDALVWGLLVGTLLQVILQLPALRDARLRFNFNWRHPALRRIFILYLPIVVSLLVNQVAIGFSYRLATGEGDQSIAFMDVATTLLQFPLGLVVTALSIATLPTLSRHASRLEWGAYRETLAGGLRLVLTLILPATVGLFALAVPIVRLLFERGAFTPADTEITALVLRAYLFGLPFAAVDQMLVFASYARQDTWRPALVGFVSIAIYSLVAVLLLRPLSLLSLMVADAVKHAVHTLLMLWLLERGLGGLRGYRIGSGLLKTIVASLLTAVVAAAAGALLQSWLPADTFISRLLIVVGAGTAGLLVFIGTAWLIDLREVKMLLRLLGTRVRRRA